MNIKVVSVSLTNGEISALGLALELSVDTVFFQVFPDDVECMCVQGTRTFPRYWFLFKTGLFSIRISRYRTLR